MYFVKMFKKTVLSIFLMLSVFAFLAASAQAQFDSRDKVAQKILNTNLNHGMTLNVRQLLDDLVHGDHVVNVVIVANSFEQGSGLELIVDNQVIASEEVGPTLENISFQLNMSNGVDYQRLQVRAIGSVFVERLQAIIVGGLVPGPGPIPIPPPSGNHGIVLQGLKVGSEAMIRSGYFGRVQGVFGNGLVAFRTQGGSNLNVQYGDVSQLGCHDHICSGRDVYWNGYFGKTIGIFPNGDVALRTQGGSLLVGQFESTAAEGCLMNFCSGKETQTIDGYYGRIIGYTGDQTRIALRTLGGSLLLKPLRDVSVAGCLGQVCTGNRVQTLDGYTGVATGIFPYVGKVAIKTLGGSLINRNYSDVAVIN